MVTSRKRENFLLGEYCITMHVFQKEKSRCCCSVHREDRRDGEVRCFLKMKGQNINVCVLFCNCVPYTLLILQQLI